ncbi:hypothetical protein JZ751_027659, partial [Albula glossodonta]
MRSNMRLSLLAIHTTQPWFHSRLSRDDAHRLIAQQGLIDGVFLLRDSQSNPKTFVLSLCHTQRIKHFQILPGHSAMQTEAPLCQDHPVRARGLASLPVRVPEHHHQHVPCLGQQRLHRPSSKLRQISTKTSCSELIPPRDSWAHMTPLCSGLCISSRTEFNVTMLVYMFLWAGLIGKALYKQREQSCKCEDHFLMNFRSNVNCTAAGNLQKLFPTFIIMRVTAELGYGRDMHMHAVIALQLAGSVVKRSLMNTFSAIDPPMAAGRDGGCALLPSPSPRPSPSPSPSPCPGCLGARVVHRRLEGCRLETGTLFFHTPDNLACSQACSERLA